VNYQGNVLRSFETETGLRFSPSALRSVLLASVSLSEMTKVVSQLSEDDMLVIAAYTASLKP
jgi:hypothetical protein